MESDRGRLTADQHRQRLKARTQLCRMALHEGIASKSESESVERQRLEYAALYRRVIGVDPSRRHDLRLALETIADGGGGDVQDIFDRLKAR